MNLLEELKSEKKNLFQFYIIVGDAEKNKKIVSGFLEDEYKTNFNENFLSMRGVEKDNYIFKIEDARKLKKENSILGGGESKKIIFLDYKKINTDTQNALLKTFEETGLNSHIFLFVPDQEFLLATIKSRARIISGEYNFEMKLAKDFFEGDFVKKEKIIKNFERSDISIFLNSLEKLILENEKIDREFYKKFLELKKYIFDKGVSLKNILTWIGINLKKNN